MLIIKSQIRFTAYFSYLRTQDKLRCLNRNKGTVDNIWKISLKMICAICIIIQMRELCSFVKEMCTNIDRGLCTDLLSLGMHDMYRTRQITRIFKKEISISCLFYAWWFCVNYTSQCKSFLFATHHKADTFIKVIYF